ncbi:ABC transporter ATP-binding protein [Longirhabdus pacifica]|uniref:ABC transporter ATP-binding protein n=1 Tax=Longirhabdus pacifica TaxID=2305227 RepID=UPI0010088730|nr:ABC transporter ATP-binding protein [Longirhabdus pacifica]
MNAIVTTDLTKFYGKHRGVSHINLQIKQGEIFGFIGPNGAGKSTTIRMLMQLMYPSSGRIEVLGQHITGQQHELRKKIGYLPSEIQLYKDMSAKKILEFSARSFGLSLKETKVFEYAETLQFDMNKKVKAYSMGNRKKLGILLSLLHHPQLLILDEPTSGLDPLVQHSFFDLLQQLNKEGMTIFFSTHVLSEVEKVCDRVAMIRNGEIIRTAQVNDMMENQVQAVEVYFKESGDLIQKYEMQEWNGNVEYDNGMHHFMVKGDMHVFLRHVSNHPIKDISIHKPTLEQLFMQYYEEGVKA